MPPLVEMRHITKRFPGVVANQDVSLTVESGTIHALVGENGAGKSTLMNILYGLHQPDTGQIMFDGRPVHIPNPHTAIRLGIGMVHQHFQLVPSLTTAENIALGHEPGHGPLLDRRAIIRRVAQISADFGLDVDPFARVGDLPVGVQQRVEILKLLYRQARLLILDEPSAVLTPREVEDLFAVLRRLVEGGRTAIFITHKLHEVMAICHHATVLRRGQVVGEVQVADTSPAELARMMVGHEVSSLKHPPASAVGTEQLILRQIHARSDRGLPALQAVSLSICAGEIVGLAGVEGNGQSELVEALVGLRPVDGGVIELAGQAITHWDNRRRREVGLAVIPEDRTRQGLSKTLRVWENLVATRYYQPPMSRFSWLQSASIRQFARQLIEQFDIRTSSENAELSTLSGGNAQKVVIARELSRRPVALIAAQPTRGLDVGAAQFVHEHLLQLRNAGVAVLLISADLDELLALADRFAVIFRGRIVGLLSAEEATRERLGLLMAGRVSEQPLQLRTAVS